MINDFGEKIGGARKDVWKERGLMVEDLNGMTQGEKEKYVKKDCIWPKEDMKALVANGMPRFVVYFRNEVRKWVHPQPKEQISAEAYIDGVRKIKGLAESIKEESDIPVFVDRMTSMILFKSGRYYDYVDGYRGIIKGQNILNYGRNIKLRQLKARMFKERFAMTEEEIMNHEYPILYVDGDTFVIEENMGKLYVVQKFPNGKIFYHPTNGIVPKEQTWFVLRGNDIVFLNENKEECVKEQKKLFDLSETKKPKKPVPKRKTPGSLRSLSPWTEPGMTSGMEGTYPEMISLKPSTSAEVNLATGPMKKNARPLWIWHMMHSMTWQRLSGSGQKIFPFLPFPERD